MCVHESRQDHATGRIDNFRLAWHLLFDYVRRPRGDNRAIAHQHSAVLYDGQITELSADPRPFRTSERDELRSVENRERFQSNNLLGTRSITRKSPGVGQDERQMETSQLFP